MRKLTFILVLLGIFALFILLNLQKPLEITSPSQLSNLEINQKVLISGKVVSESLQGSTRLLKFNNSLEVCIKSPISYVNRTLTLIGITSKYLNKTEIQALRIIK